MLLEVVNFFQKSLIALGSVLGRAFSARILLSLLCILIIATSCNHKNTLFSMLHETALKDDAESQLALGYMYYMGKNGVRKSCSKSFYWYGKAAALGNDEAQAALALFYYKGECNAVKKDFAKTFYWAQKAAEQNNAMASFILSIMYYKGCGVGKSMENHMLWLKKSAELGHRAAKIMLNVYKNNKHIPIE